MAKTLPKWTRPWPSFPAVARPCDGRRRRPPRCDRARVLAYLAADDIPGTLFDADVVANVPLFADLDPSTSIWGGRTRGLLVASPLQEAISVHRLVQTLMRLHLANTGRHEACIESAVLVFEAPCGLGTSLGPSSRSSSRTSGR